MLGRMAPQQILEVMVGSRLNVHFQGDFVTKDGDKSQEDQQERLPLVVGSCLENPVEGQWRWVKDWK